jgi:hypothetical protein
MGWVLGYTPYLVKHFIKIFLSLKGDNFFMLIRHFSLFPEKFDKIFLGLSRNTDGYNRNI